MTNIEKLLEEAKRLREAKTMTHHQVYQWDNYNKFISDNAEKYERIIAMAVEALKEFKEEFHDSDGYDSDEHGIESCGIACKALKQIEEIAGEK